MEHYPEIQRRDGTLFFACPDTDRTAIATSIERLIDMLDAMDGDPDLEPYLAGWERTGGDDREGDLDANGYPGLSEGDGNSDDEPSLGWNDAVNQSSQSRFGDKRGLDLEENGDEQDCSHIEDEWSPLISGRKGFDGSGVEVAEELLSTLPEGLPTAKQRMAAYVATAPFSLHIGGRS